MISRKISTLILDLDDTIYPVSSIGRDQFNDLFESMDFQTCGYDQEIVSEIITALWERPMADVALQFNFPERLITTYRQRASEIDFDFRISPYPDYTIIRELPLTRHLVTTGTAPVQEKKIDALNIRADFSRILIDDPFLIQGGKEKCFREIISQEELTHAEVLVIGDNAASEIAAAEKIGINYLLIDRSRDSPDFQKHIISSFRDLYFLP